MQAQPVAHGTQEMVDQVAFPRRGRLYLIQLRIAAPNVQGGFGAERRSKHRRASEGGLQGLLHFSTLESGEGLPRGRPTGWRGAWTGCQAVRVLNLPPLCLSGGTSEKSMNLSLPVSSLKN